MRLLHTEPNACGTSLQGYQTVDYNELVRIFGRPTYSVDAGHDLDKVNFEWSLLFKDDDGREITATIYDWKTSPTHSKASGYRWHIGGRDFYAVAAVSEYIREWRESNGQ